MFNIPKLRKIFIISLLFITFIGCDNNDDWIPSVRVDIYINLIQLADVGHLQAKNWDGGVNGIIIVRLGDNQFNAFDRTCSFEPVKNCAIEFDAELLAASCPCCESLFELFESGAVQRGPARRPLKKYRTFVSGERLHISN
jgi:nitrite reductase/ring-hydroxylating ferredoxin subunit